MGSFQILRKRGEFRLRLGHGHARLQVAFHGQVSGVAGLQNFGVSREGGNHHERDVKSGPDVLIHANEAVGCDANDGELGSVQADFSSQDRFVGAELLFPEIVIEHYNRVSSRGLILVGPERTSEFGPDSHGFEKISIYGVAEFHLCQRLGFGREAGDDAAIGNQFGEAPVVVAEVAVIRVGIDEAGEPFDRCLGSDSDHFAGPGHRQWTQQQRVGPTEHGGVSADADGQ